jgi:predicted nucleic acid-binding protein
MSGWGDPGTPFVYDAGALVAAENGSRRMLGVHAEAIHSGREIAVPAPVLAQVWRGGARQVRLSRLLDACRVDETSAKLAKAAGVLLGVSRSSDAVDAIVVATALALRAIVVTSDPDDLRRLGEAAAPSKFRLALVTV